MRRLLKIAGVLGGVYVLLLVGLFVAMCQPPDVFGRIMSKTPDVAFFILPFKQFWMIAREGRLKVGDIAPDFSLHTVDKKSRIRLSSLRRQKPVVLVFGSYT
jgi:hypothetical protein